MPATDPRGPACDTVVLRVPMAIRLERRYRNAVAVLRGPLVFSLKMGEEFRLLKGEPPLADWEVDSTTAWNDGPVADQRFSIREAPVSAIPFAPDAAPLTLTAQARRVPQWGLEHNSAGMLPQSRVATTEPVEQIELIPYGSTNLRITEFPEVEAQ